MFKLLRFWWILDPKKHLEQLAAVDEFRDKTVKVKMNKLVLWVDISPTMKYTVFIFPLQKRILGVNALLEYTLNVFEGSSPSPEGLNCKGSG